MEEEAPPRQNFLEPALRLSPPGPFNPDTMDLSMWLPRVDRFLAQYQGEDHGTLAAWVLDHLEGSAALLTRDFDLQQEHPWEALRTVLIDNFSPRRSPILEGDRLFQFRQGGRPIAVFVKEFSSLLISCPSVTKEMATWFFVQALDPYFSKEVRRAAPESFEQAVRIASLIFPPPPPPSSSSFSHHSRNPRKGISPEEKERRRANNLCLFCASPSHQVSSCPVKPKPPHLYSVSPSLFVPISISDTEIKGLLDSGSSFSFISRSLLPSLNLVPSAGVLHVTLANGQSLSLTEKVSTVISWCSFSFPLTFWVSSFPQELILGLDFLALAKPTIDWSSLSVSPPPSVLKRPSLLPPLPDSTSGLPLSRPDVSMKDFAPFPSDPPLLPPSPLLSVTSSFPFDLSTVHHLGRDILQEFTPIFVESLPPRLPPERDIVHHINLKPGSSPAFCRPYKTSLPQREAMEKEIEELLSKGFIRRSRSPWSSPTFFVPKKDGKLRMVINYTKVNALCELDRYVLPLMSDCLDRLRGAKVFSSLDAVSGYYQIRVHPPDVPVTAFTTPFGNFEFLVLPFGLASAPSTFARLMDSIFPSSFRKFLVWYLDDLLIFSVSPEEHVKHLNLVLQKLKEHQIFLKPSKCSFFQEKVTFLGHQVSSSGVSCDDSKISAVRDFPTPKDVTGVRSFLGLVGFYGRFIKDFSTVAAPLSDLTKRGIPFHWNDKEQEAFDSLKKSLISAPILLPPNPRQPFVLETDASGIGLGAVLSQEDDSGDLRPVSFHSRKLSKHETNYAVHEKETLAVVDSIQKFRHLLEGTHTKVITDHSSIKYLLTQPNLSGRQARWLEKLQGLDLSIVYRPGPQNHIADSLSRFPSSGFLNLISTSLSLETVLTNSIKAGYSQDPFLSGVIKVLAGEEPLKSPPAGVVSVLHRYLLQDGLLYKIDDKSPRLCVPRIPQIITKILQEHHDSPLAGHHGFEKTYSSVSKLFYWRKMDKSVKEFVRSCFTCQRVKPSVTLHPPPFPLDVPEKPWESISLDFIGPLPKSSLGHDSVLVFVDRFSKMAHFAPTTTTVDALGTAKLFINHVFRLHGLPTSIISDRDPRFVSSFWKEIFRALGISLNISTSNHPQTDGQTEVVNKQLGNYLKSFASTSPSTWDSLLPLAEISHNSSRHSSTRFSPFEVCYSFAPRFPSDFVVPSNLSSSRAGYFLKEFDNVFRSCRDSIHEAQIRQSSSNFRPSTLPSYKAGDLVLLDSSSTFSPSSKALPSKFRPSFLGPFMVTKVTRTTVTLNLPPTMRVHPVFHLSKIKPFVPNDELSFPGRVVPPPPPISSDEFEVDSILAQRIFRGKRQYLVRWKGFGPDDDTWEPEENLTNAKETLLDFQAILKGGGVEKY